MKRIFSILSFVLLPGLLLAANKKTGLADALKNKTINMEAVNFMGLYLGKSTRLTITNNTKSTLEIKVDMGAILKPEEPSYQPMVLAGEETLVVGPHGKGQIEVLTFCGKGSASCPRKDLRYSFSHVGNDSLIQVLRYIKANKLYDALGQSAVWAVIDHHRINTVYDPERDAVSQRLIETVSRITNSPKPTYYAYVPQTAVPDQPVFQSKALKMYAQFEIVLQAPKTMTLGVFNEEGAMIQSVFENKEFGASGHRFEVEFETSTVWAGKYYIRLKEGDAVLQEKMVEVE